MWTTLIFLAIVGFAAAGNEQTPWQPNQEYTYNIYARTLTALPDLKDQYVGIVTKGKLILHPQTNGHIVGKLNKMAHAHFHDDLVDGWDSEIPEQALSFKESSLNNKAFIMHMKNGVVEKIIVDQSLTNDEVNQLKAILNQLQIDVTGQNLVKCKHNQLPERNNKPNAFYKTMEPTFTGECETVYDIAPLPEYMLERSSPNWVPEVDIKNEETKAKGHYFQVVKTINYDNCNMRKGYHFGITGESDFKPNTNQMGDFLSKSSVTKIVASGNINDFTIHQVYTTNRVAVSPAMYQKQRAQVISQIQLQLIKVQDVSKPMEGPKQSVETGNLVYRYNIPSDKDNKIRTGVDMSSYRREHVNYDRFENQESEESKRRFPRDVQDEENLSGNMNSKQRRQNQDDSSSSSSSESFEDFEQQRHHFQPRPNMQEAPEIPLLPFTVGNKGRSIKFDSQINVEGEARKLAEDIADDLQVQDEIPKRDTLEKFDILTDLVRIMSAEKIQNVAQQLHVGENVERQSENLKKVLAAKTFRDAVAQAGTGPAVNVVSKWILDRKIKGNEAVELITAMVKNIRTPTNEVIKTLYNVVKSEEVKKQKVLYPTALIAFTDLVRRAYVDKNSGYNYYPVQSFGPFYKELDQIVVNDVIPYLGQRLQESVQQKNSQKVLLYIRALGNTGHPKIIGILEKYFEADHQLTQFQRSALVIALDRLAEIYPNVARRILYKIYTNIGETPETRSIAVHLLMRTNPSAAMLQRMAEYTHDDPSEAVQSIVKSAIESAAELVDNEWLDLAKNAESAKKFLNPRDYGRQYSKSYLRDYFSRNLNLVYRQQLSHIIGPDHTFPQSIFYTVRNSLGGFEKKQIEVQSMISSVEQILQLIPNSHADRQNENDWVNNDNTDRKEHNRGNADANADADVDADGQWSTNKIKKMLNIERENSEQIEGQILFNVMGHKRYFSFDEETLKDLPQTLMSYGSAFTKGEKLTINKFYNRKQIIVAFPLATGYPFQFTYSLPTLIQVIGDVNGKTKPDIFHTPSWENFKNLETINVTGKVHVVLSSEQISKIGFVTPFERQTYVSGYIRKLQGHIPLNVDVNVDVNKREITGRLSPIEKTKDFQLYHSSAWPFTVRKDVYNNQPISKIKDTKIIQTRKNEKYERVIGDKTTGMVFTTNIEHQFSIDNYLRNEKALQKQGVLALTSLPYSYQETMQKIFERRVFNPLTFIPFGFDPTSYGPSEKQILMMLSSIPFGDDLTTSELIKSQGLISLLTLPFFDVETLERTNNHERILTTGMVHWPLETLNQYKINVHYDAKRSENHAIKFSLRLKHMYNVNKNDNIATSNRMNGPANLDDRKLLETSDYQPNSENRHHQFLENAAFGINQAYSVALDASIVFDGNSPAEYIATIGQAGSLADEKKRLLAIFSAKPMKQTKHKQMCLVYTGKFPHAPVLSFDDAIKQNNKANAKIQVTFGDECKEKSSTQINVKILFEQTSDYKENLKKSELGKRCQHEINRGNNLMKSCLRATYHANIYDKISISSEMVNPTEEINNITQRALSLLRHIGYWRLEDKINEKGHANQMDAIIKLSSNLNYIDAEIQTNHMLHKFNKIHIEPTLKTLFNVHQQMDMQGRAMSQLYKSGHVCVVDVKNILTFDDSIIKPKLGQCWYNVFQYVQQKSKQHSENVQSEKFSFKDISILVRETKQQSDKKELMLVVKQKSGVDHVVHMKPNSGSSSTSGSVSSIQVAINGQERKLSNDKAIDVFDRVNNLRNDKEGLLPVVRIIELPRKEVKIEIRGKLLQVVYDGYRVKITAHPVYRNNVRGLCGNFNGEQIDDMMTPKNCVLRNEKLYAATWAITEQTSCSNDVKQLKNKAEQTHCAPIEYKNGNNIISNWEAGRHKNSNKDDTKKWSSESRSRSTSSSSSSSSSEENQYDFNLRNLKINRKNVNNSNNKNNQNERNCNIRKQMQFVELTGRTCFSVESLAACPSHCQIENYEQIEVPVHCRESEDSVTQMFIQQIRKGANPDMSNKKVNNNLIFKIPKNCVASY